LKNSRFDYLNKSKGNRDCKLIFKVGWFLPITFAIAAEYLFTSPDISDSNQANAVEILKNNSQ
jgi:hypothetical protein